MEISIISSKEEQTRFLQQQCREMLRYYNKKIEDGDIRSKNDILLEWIYNNSANYRKEWINGCL